MAKDYSASRIRTSALIVSGGLAGTDVGLAIYSASIASDFDGGITKNSSLFDGVGVDVFLFVSGTIGSKGSTTKGTTVFGGDVLVSGSFHTSGAIYRKNKIVLAQNYTVLSDDHHLYFDTIANDVTATLPTISKSTAGRELVCKDVGGNAATNGILLTGSSNIDGVPNLTINKSFGTVTVTNDGTGMWFILVSSGALSHT